MTDSITLLDWRRSVAKLYAHLKESQTHTTCYWKGVASYYDIEVDGKVKRDAAWYYPATKEAAQSIQGYVAFWRGVRIEA